MSPNEYCQQKASTSGSSFYYSFLFLPQEQRSAITALYAFCREVDDVVDECSEPQIARIKLQWWREEIQQTFAGSARHPVTQALQPCLSAFKLPIEHFLEIIDGMQMDLEQTRYPCFDDLASYCYRVAGVVGLLSVAIFGFRNPATMDYARDLGTALQLTNILRDLREDASRGRIYIPEDEMRRHEVDPEDILNLRDGENLRALLTFQAQRAHRYYEQALRQLPDEDRYRQRGGLIMAQIYRSTLREIERDGFQVMQRRVALTPVRKLWIAWRTACREKRISKRRQRQAPKD